MAQYLARHFHFDATHRYAQGVAEHVGFVFDEIEKQIPDALAMMAHAEMAYDAYLETFKKVKGKPPFPRVRSAGVRGARKIGSEQVTGRPS